MYTCTQAYTHMHACMRAHTHKNNLYTYTTYLSNYYTYTHMHACIHTDMHTHACVRMPTHTHTHTGVYIHSPSLKLSHTHTHTHTHTSHKKTTTTTNPHEPEVSVAREVVERTGGLEPLGNIGAPAEERGQGPADAPQPHQQDHGEGPAVRQGAGRLDGLGDDVVTVNGNHGHCVDGHQAEDRAHQRVQLAG